MSSSFYPRRRSAARSREFAVHAPHRRPLPPWVPLSIGTNILLLSLVILSLGRFNFSLPILVPSSDDAKVVPYEQTPPSKWIDANQNDAPDTLTNDPQLGPRLQWTYDEWVSQLEREANAVARSAPENLNILLGDSISLWFPHELLPYESTWLNQGISGEGSVGVLRRLDLIADTRPQVLYLMIGINDLLRGVGDETILANQRQIIQDLKAMHPDTAIIVQAILPHAGDRSTWEGKEQLLTISNERIHDLNERLSQMAQDEEVDYLDLLPLFSDEAGNLRIDLTTDGLHLNDDGYRVWATALQLHQDFNDL